MTWRFWVMVVFMALNVPAAVQGNALNAFIVGVGLALSVWEGATWLDSRGK